MEGAGHACFAVCHKSLLGNFTHEDNFNNININHTICIFQMHLKTIKCKFLYRAISGTCD